MPWFGALLLAAFLVNAPLPFLAPVSAQETSSSSDEEEDEDLEGFEDDEDEDLEGFEDDEDGFGDDDGFGDGEDGGFQDIEIDVGDIVVEEPKDYSFGGFLKQDISYAFAVPDKDLPFTRDRAEINKFRTTANLEFNWTISPKWKLKISGNSFYDAYYTQQGRDEFPDETLDAYERESEFRDTFVEGNVDGGLWLKVGRQIIAWGESEGTQIVDMANPRDNRELGLVDIEDARIPVFATKISYLVDNWELNLVGIHEFRANKTGTEGSDYDPYVSFRKNAKIDDAEDPKDEDARMELLARVFRSFNGGDFSLIAADTLEDDSYLDFDPQFGGYIPRYKRIRTYGVAGNFVKGSWLFKMEAASKKDSALARTPEDLQAQLRANVKEPKSWSEKDLTQLMLGVDYSGVTDLSVTFEVSATQIEDYEDNLMNDEIRAAPSLTLRYDTWNDTLHPSFLWVRLPNDNGDLIRASADYDLMDALQLSGGFALYDAAREDDLLYAYKENDRLFASIKYSF